MAKMKRAGRGQKGADEIAQDGGVMLLDPSESAVAKPPIDIRTGAAIRRNRLERGLTLSDVASVSDVSVPMLSRIENGQSSASLAILERICAGLGIDLSSLFGDIEQTAGSAQLIKSVDQMEVVRTGTKHGHTYRLLSYHRGPHKIFEPFLIEMNGASEVYPRFQHPGTEFIYMLKGRMEYRFGDRTFLLEPGDAFTFSGTVIHGPEKLYDDHIQFITLIIYAE